MDPATTLELHRQKVAQMIQEAAVHGLARSAATGRARRLGRWRRRPVRDRGGHVAATA